VEREHNGLYFYDRTPKFDAKRLHAITARPAAYEKEGPSSRTPNPRKERQWQVLVGAAPDGDSLCQPYRYTTATPAAEWTSAGFDDSDWNAARAPFGTINNPRTQWTSSDIWIRRSFTWTGNSLHDAALVIFWDEDTDVYVNGQKIWSRSGFTTAYEIFTVADALKKTLKPGANTLAIHTHQTGGGQFIDLALFWE
jgi:hypothetical protein